ncbi:MAG: glycosyltransferase [Phycisphaerales bacterium]|nr:glycosyltransferase [Phycisphaerales bacterium]
MGPLWILLAIVGSVAGAVLAIYWTVGLARIIKTITLLPTARHGLALPAPDAAVCVVIPAHNEAAVIGNLIHSLRQQDYKQVRFVLALDRCTDNTAEIARAAAGPDERFEIFEITECPDDWAGKVNAIWTALHRSGHARAAEFLIFADADTTFHPGCVRAATALAVQRQLDLLSLTSTLTCDTWFERLIQPAAAMELMQQYPPLRASRAENRRAFANGQFILFRAAPYWAFGGHETVKDHLLEDLGISRVAAREGLAAALLNADGVLVCRMYHSWPEFRKGWKRIYTECANRKPGRLLRSTWRVRIVYGTLPPLAAAGLLTAALAPLQPSWLAVGTAIVGGYGLLVWLAALAAVYHLAAAPLWSAPLHPLACWRVAGILREAAHDLIHDKPTEWGGRAYSRVSRG